MIKFTRQYKENVFFLLLSFLLAPFLYILTYKFKNKDKLKILVIQTAKIGDIVCSTPVFREIKKKYPESFLSVMVIPLVKDILINNPYIDEIIILDRKKYSGIKGIFQLIRQIKEKRFDWSFSLLPGILNNTIPFWAGISNRVATISKHTTRGTKISSIFNNYYLEYQRHTLALRHYLNLLKFIKINQTNEKKEVFIKLIEEEKALQFLEKNNFKKKDFLVGISVAAGNEFKEWSLKKFAKLADKLIEEHKANIIFIGSNTEYNKIIKTQSMMKNKSINSSRKFSLSEIPALFKHLNLFISVDTGSLYIANAMNVPVVDIVGPIDIYEQPPLGDKCEIVQKDIDCAPCSFILPPARFCKKGHKNCIKKISVNDVYVAIKKILYDFKI